MCKTPVVNVVLFVSFWADKLFSIMMGNRRGGVGVRGDVFVEGSSCGVCILHQKRWERPEGWSVNVAGSIAGCAWLSESQLFRPFRWVCLSV